MDLELLLASDPVEIEAPGRRILSNMDVTEDGQRFLVTMREGVAGDVDDTAPATPRIKVVFNWFFEELKRRAPTGR